MTSSHKVCHSDHAWQRKGLIQRSRYLIFFPSSRHLLDSQLGQIWKAIFTENNVKSLKQLLHEYTMDYTGQKRICKELTNGYIKRYQKYVILLFFMSSEHSLSTICISFSISNQFRIRNSIQCHFDLHWCPYSNENWECNQIRFYSTHLICKMWKAVQNFNILGMVHVGNNAVYGEAHIQINKRTVSSRLRADGWWYPGPHRCGILLYYSYQMEGWAANWIKHICLGTGLDAVVFPEQETWMSIWGGYTLAGNAEVNVLFIVFCTSHSSPLAYVLHCHS